MLRPFFDDLVWLVATFQKLYPDVSWCADKGDTQTRPQVLGLHGEFGALGVEVGSGCVQVLYPQAKMIQPHVGVDRPGWSAGFSLGYEDDQAVDIDIDPGLTVGLDTFLDLGPEPPRRHGLS